MSLTTICTTQSFAMVILKIVMSANPPLKVMVVVKITATSPTSP